MLLNDEQILELCMGERPMIQPFIATKVSELRRVDGSAPRRIVSFGLGSSGYDIRLGKRIGILNLPAGIPIRPLEMDTSMYSWHESDAILIAANSYILAESMETFHLPRDVVGVAVGKSTLARVGVFPNITPLEPGWRGVLTIEIANLGKHDVILRAGEGIAQILFHRIDDPQADYGQLGGKYNDQKGVQIAK